jgi:hypothetical protein
VTGATGPTGPSGAGSGSAGPTGPTGAAGKGTTGSTGERGPTGPTGGGGGGGGAATAFAPLASKQQESGTWSATISEPVGAPQTQANGAASFSLPYPEEAELKIRYIPESENIVPVKPCLGSVNEPIVEAELGKGALCVYRGSGFPKEGSDKNAKFVGFFSAFGEKSPSGAVLNKEESAKFKHGMMIGFRTTEYSEATPVTLGTAASLTASGSWAITAP